MTDPASGARPKPGGGKDETQRVRIGLTGLGFVFVAVLLAMALAGAPTSEAPITDGEPTAQHNGAVAPKEPLAELGVAPGNADTEEGEAQLNAAGQGNETRRAFR